MKTLTTVSQSALRLSRERLLALVNYDQPAYPPIIYISRFEILVFASIFSIFFLRASKIRNVENESLLISAIEDLVGRSNLYVWPNALPRTRCICYISFKVYRGGNFSVAGIALQAKIFSTAQIIIGWKFGFDDSYFFILVTSSGAHGAWMTNIVFAPSNASVVEFPLKPHCNRFFGYM